ncbi:hypothetical protein ABID23_000691 [Bartonella silvatica]|uniref:Uncharacterized protein n=1 Tax=Bartonella silvatica TaxID=357760 RepID=A0ABV2HGT1_9HYPH
MVGQDGKEHVVFMVSYGLDFYVLLQQLFKLLIIYGQASRFDRFNLNRFGIKKSYVIWGSQSI